MARRPSRARRCHRSHRDRTSRAGSRLLASGTVLLLVAAASVLGPGSPRAGAAPPTSARHVLVAGQLGSITYLTPTPSTPAVVGGTDLAGDTFQGAVVAPDGETGYLTRGDNRIFVVDPIAGARIDDFEVPGGGTQADALAISPDGSILAVEVTVPGDTVNRREVRLIRLADRAVLQAHITSSNQSIGAESIVFTADGTHVVWGAARSLTYAEVGVPNATNGIQVDGGPFDLGVTPVGAGNLVVSAEGTGDITVFDFGAMTPSGFVPRTSYPVDEVDAIGAVRRVAVHPEGHLVLLGTDTHLQWFSLVQRTVVGAPLPLNAGGRLNTLVLHPDGRHAVVIADTTDRELDDTMWTVDLADGSIAGAVGIRRVNGETIHGAMQPALAPTASFSVAPSNLAGTPAVFNAGDSAGGPGAGIAEHHWDFGDGGTAVTPGPTVEHTYAAGGTYTATLRVVDTNGVSTAYAYTGHGVLRAGGPSAVTTREVVVVGAANVGLSVEPSEAVVGDEVTFRGVLLGPGGDPLPGRTLHFDGPGGSFGSATTDAGGIARLARSDLPLGEHSAVARFDGEQGVAGPASSQPAAFEVVEQPTALDLDVEPAAPDADDAIRLVATIDPVALGAAAAAGSADAEAAAVEDCAGSVTFDLDGQAVGTSAVGGTGSATLDLPAQPVGDHVATATYTSSNGCAGATASLGFPVVGLPPSTSTTSSTAPPTGGSVPVQPGATAPATAGSATATPTSTSLARTGSSTWLLTATGAGLVAGGLALRRRAAARLGIA